MAAGIVPVPLAVAVGVVLLTSGLAVAFTLGPPMAAVVGLYVTLTICYSLVLKAIPVVDIAAVATGFLLRAIGGAVAVGVPVSGPFLLVASFAALFLVVGKRHGERSLLADGAVAHRPTLAAYTPEFTSQLISLSLAGTVISYAAWAFGLDAGEPGVPWVAVSVLPFTVGMMRATQLVLRGEGADPEALLADRGVLLAGVLTAALLIVGLYIW